MKKKNWYVLQAFSGFENRIIESIKESIQLKNMEKLFGDIIIPSEKIIKIKSGKRTISKKRIFPGYILIQMHMNEKSWHVIRNIPRVIGFIGGNPEKPSFIENQEVQNILKKLSKPKKQKPKILFKIKEKVRIKNGPFIGFYGIVEEVDYEKNKLKILILIFGRSTPVKLDFMQVEKNI